MSPTQLCRGGASALVFSLLVACGGQASRSGSASPEGSTGDETPTPAATAELPSQGGSPVVVRAGGAAPEPIADALTLIAHDVTLSREIQAGVHYVYFVTHPYANSNVPGQLVRMPIAGGEPQVLIDQIGGSEADLQLYGSALYYKNDLEIRSYDLAKHRDCAVAAASEIGGNALISSFKMGPDGLYFATGARKLYSRASAGAPIVTTEIPDPVERILKAESEYVLTIQALHPFMLGIQDTVREEMSMLVPAPSASPFSPLPVDDEAYYYLDATDTGTALRRVRRSYAVPIGYWATGERLHEQDIVTLSEWSSKPSSDLLLFKQTLLVRMEGNVWFGINKDYGASTLLPQLSPCAFLFANDDDLFCATAEGEGADLYRVSLGLLAH